VTLPAVAKPLIPVNLDGSGHWATLSRPAGPVW
jgi:hypothetical protein